MSQGAPPRSVLLDLDGTLTDPRHGITRCIRHALTALGMSAPAEHELLWAIGPPLLDSLRSLLGPGAAHLAPRALELYRERFSRIGKFENAVYPGVPEMLTALRDGGMALYLATSKPAVFAADILAHFELTPFFAGVHGSELDGTRVDKEELIRHILDVEDLSPGETVMVGDRSHDICGAQAAGIAAIGVLYGYGDRRELAGAGAERLADTPADVARILLR